MPAGTIGGAVSGGGGGGAGSVPFLIGTHEYAEPMPTNTWQTTANAQEFVLPITPGGFLRGVRLTLSSTGGVAGTLAADAPLSILSSISLENIDGSPIIYPMPGYSFGMWVKYFTPWHGDPAKVLGWNTAIATPGFSLPVRAEIRNTAGVLANTDARSQYRFRYTFAPTTGYGTGYTTAPTFTAETNMEAYTQVDPTDLNGNPIQDLPDGLNIARIVRHQVVTLNNAGANNIIQLANTGNELRGILLLCRDSTGARQDALSTPIRMRLDDRSLGVFTTNEVFQRMYSFYDFLQNGTSTRETGVYMFPRFRDPGRELGSYWLPTSNATYLIIESTTAAGISGPGTIEIITDEVIPVGPISADLEGA